MPYSLPHSLGVLGQVTQAGRSCPSSRWWSLEVGHGTFEAGATMALVMCGAPHDVAVLYALTYHLTHVLPVALVATMVYLVRSRSRATRATGPEQD